MIVSKRAMMIGAGAMLAAALTAGALIATAHAAVAVGGAAPAFSVKDADGKARSLSEFAGKTVVLEWTNPKCPYVRKHYGGGAMQALQKEATADGVVWLTVDSSGPGTPGYVDGAGAKRWIAKEGAAPTAFLVDADGAMGRAFGAKATPHMFVLVGGKVVYEGAIDDRPSTRPKSLDGARNYVREALSAVKSGQPPAIPATTAYGCTVEYAS